MEMESPSSSTLGSLGSGVMRRSTTLRSAREPFSGLGVWAGVKVVVNAKAAARRMDGVLMVMKLRAVVTQASLQSCRRIVGAAAFRKTDYSTVV